MLGTVFVQTGKEYSLLDGPLYLKRVIVLYTRPMLHKIFKNLYLSIL